MFWTDAFAPILLHFSNLQLKFERLKVEPKFSFFVGWTEFNCCFFFSGFNIQDFFKICSEPDAFAPILFHFSNFQLKFKGLKVEPKFSFLWDEPNLNCCYWHNLCIGNSFSMPISLASNITYFFLSWFCQAVLSHDIWVSQNRFLGPAKIFHINGLWCLF